jgi:hypothetical protein
VFALRHPEHEFSWGVVRMARGLIGGNLRPGLRIPHLGCLPNVNGRGPHLASSYSESSAMQENDTVGARAVCKFGAGGGGVQGGLRPRREQWRSVLRQEQPARVAEAWARSSHLLSRRTTSLAPRL